MYLIALDSETDFDGWRKAARALALHHVTPMEVTWGVQGQAKDLVPPGLSEAPSLPPVETEGTFNVPANFVELARVAILHRDRARFALLYRLLWRLKADHDLLATMTEPDVAEAETEIAVLAAPPANGGLMIREIWLERMRALLARARGDFAAYTHFRDRYRDMARTHGFEGHVAWAEGMP